jgi:hypothetical protein
VGIDSGSARADDDQCDECLRERREFRHDDVGFPTSGAERLLHPRTNHDSCF